MGIRAALGRPRGMRSSSMRQAAGTFLWRISSVAHLHHDDLGLRG